MTSSSEAYKLAGVDIDAGERAVELMKASIAKSRRKEVVGDLGGFARTQDSSGSFFRRSARAV